MNPESISVVSGSKQGGSGRGTSENSLVSVLISVPITTSPTGDLLAWATLTAKSSLALRFSFGLWKIGVRNMCLCCRASHLRNGLCG